MAAASGAHDPSSGTAASCRRVAAPRDVVLAALGCAVWSIAGTVLRILFSPFFASMGFLTPGLTYFGYNAVGSFLMGLVAGLLDPNESYVLFRCLATGFCGAFTSFSTWIAAAALLTPSEEASQSVVQIVCGLCVYPVAYVLGRDAASSIIHVGNLAPSQSQRGTFTMIGEGSFVAISWVIAVCLLLALPLAGVVIDRPMLYAAVVSPVGGVARFAASHFLNGHPSWRNVPVGTLLANIAAVVIVVCVNCSGDVRKTNEVFQMVTVGICGALSTVSSWVHETASLMNVDRGLGYAYYLGTVAVSCCIAAIGRTSSSC
jgi:CrcB protein